MRRFHCSFFSSPRLLHDQSSFHLRLSLCSTLIDRHSSILTAALFHSESTSRPCDANASYQPRESTTASVSKFIALIANPAVLLFPQILQGAVYYAIAPICHVSSIVMMGLRLNIGTQIISLPYAVVLPCVCATRAFRSLLESGTEELIVSITHGSGKRGRGASGNIPSTQ